jgi:hypothetical protein
MLVILLPLFVNITQRLYQISVSNIWFMVMDTNGIAGVQLDVIDCISGGSLPYLGGAKGWNNK